MKLLSCYIYAFGTLKDFSFRFTDGLNVIKEDNGWGKSTFAAFIKAMFYGLDDAKRTIEENERKKYLPWNSAEKFGGNVVFEREGQKFKIERFFGNKESEDTLRLTDAETGKEFPDNKNLGERLFGIDEEGFSFTTYFSQKDVEAKSNSSITSKFNSVCEVQDSAAYDKAIKRLEDGAKEYFMRGGKGRIEDLKRSIRNVEYRIESANTAQKTLKDLKNSLAEISEDKKRTAENLKDLSSRFEKAGQAEAESVRRQRYDALAEKKDAKERELSSVSAVFCGRAFSEKEAGGALNCIAELNKISAQEELLDGDLQELSAKAPAGKKPVNFTLLYILSAITAAAGAGVCFLNIILGAAISVAGIAGLIVSFIVSRNKKSAAKAESEYFATIKERKARLAVLKERKSNYAVALDTFFGGFNLPEGLSYSEKAELLKQYSARREKVKSEIEEIDKEMSELLKEGVTGGDTDVATLSQLKSEQQALSAKLSDRISEEEKIKSRIKNLEAEADAVYDLENEKAQLIAEKQDCEREYGIISETVKYLTLADENLKRRYSSPLKESLNGYLKRIDKSVSASIDTDFNVKIEEKGAERDSAYFSKGYRNLFEICKRFAIIDVLYAEEKPFIMLDDPFSNLDDGKVKAALSLVEELSEEYQIIYLVCHDSRTLRNG